MQLSKKMITGLFVVLVGAITIFANPLLASAANHHYDGKSPVATGCSKTGVSKKSKSIKTRNNVVTGKVHLMFSTTCKTAWAFVQLDKKLPKGYTSNAVISRSQNKKYFWCSSKNGNGEIKAGQSTCYSPMVYDKDPYKACASAHVEYKGGLIGDGFTDCY